MYKNTISTFVEAKPNVKIQSRAEPQRPKLKATLRRVRVNCVGLENVQALYIDVSEYR